MQLHPQYPVDTRRLRLRPLTPVDVDDVLVYRSRPDVCRYVPFEPMDRAGVERSIAERAAGRAITGEGGALFVGIELASTGRVVGDLVLAFVSAEHRAGEIGWVLDPGHSGHGYATEAAHAVLHMAFDQLGLHRVVARIDDRNDASLRLADRLGMRREAHLRENEWFKGGWSDEIDFALLEQEWAELHRTGAPPGCAPPR